MTLDQRGAAMPMAPASGASRPLSTSSRASFPASAPHLASAVAALAMLAGCQVVPQKASSPAPAPTPTPAPTRAPAPSVATNLGWDVAPVALGTWRYAATQAESSATFSPVTGPSLSFRCLKASRQVAITLPGYGASRLAIIRTSAGILDWSGVTQASGGGGALVITRPATDSGLDSIAYSRGRISIEPVGVQRIILPIVSEIGRVVEDCRV